MYEVRLVLSCVLKSSPDRFPGQGFGRLSQRLDQLGGRTVSKTLIPR